MIDIQALKTALQANGIEASIKGESRILIRGIEFTISGKVVRCERLSFRFKSVKDLLFTLHAERIIKFESFRLRRISQDYQDLANITNLKSSNYEK